MFYLTNRELSETMDIFLKKGRNKVTRIKEDDGEYNSIFSPIENAIKKSNASKEEIDYILFIGGSAQSPYIQEDLKEYFEDSDMLIPDNLRTHVSKGAAIHSILFNGMNKCLIQPILSEPILVITNDERPKIILPAGTEMPTEIITINDLVTSREGQSIVELPICIGNISKLLFNLKIETSSPKGFPINSPIKITIEVNADKTLIVNAACLGHTCSVEQLNPFANKELSTEERAVFNAERQANFEKYQNKIISKDTLINLRTAYKNAGKELKAAETYEEQYEKYPKSVSLNSLGILYSDAGNHEKAVEIYEKAIEENPYNGILYFNLGIQMKYINNDLYKKYINKAFALNPDRECILIEAGCIDKAEGRYRDGEKNCAAHMNRYFINGEQAL